MCQREMKRQQRQQQQQSPPPQSQRVALPDEIVYGELHRHINEQSLCVYDFLAWHATCQALWTEYVNTPDEEIEKWCHTKKVVNAHLLLKTLRVEYKDNMVRMTELAYITLNCACIKKRIEQIAKADLFDPDMPCSVQTGFCVNRSGHLHGVSFTRNDADEEIIATESLAILGAVATRIYSRYGWRVSLVYKKKDGPVLNHDLPLTAAAAPTPCEIPIDSDVYIR